MRHRCRVLAIIPVIFLAVGCAGRDNQLKLNPQESIKTLKATAIVEFTNIKTEKGRALITVNTPDSFRIEIKGPLGVTTALISGNGDSITFLYRGESTTYKAGDARLPLRIRAAELVSMLLGAEDFPPRNDRSFTTENLPNGRSITRRFDNDLLYMAYMSDYRPVAGASLPYTISIEGRGYKLLIKYINVDLKTVTKNSYFKTTR
ncbi:MAG: hypothetical protein ACE5DW_01525 [Thermodesulfobacteriota bacterium]